MSRLDPRNYRAEARGLGSNLGNVRLRYKGPRNAHLEDLPLPKGDRFPVRGSELLDQSNIVTQHPINQKQMFGSPEVGHGGVRNLTNEQLLKFGGPRGSDPIRGLREFQFGDDFRLPGSRIVIKGGHHRTAEIARRIRAGEIPRDTLIEFQMASQ